MVKLNTHKLRPAHRIYVIIGILLFLCGLCLLAYRYNSTHQMLVKRVLVLHSYASDNPRCLYMNQLLEKELEEQGLCAEITYHYLDTERKNHKQRIECYNELLDGFSENRPDIILINDDYALSFFLLCEHPLISEIPVVFTGAYQLKWDVLKKYSNITGKWDHVDYLANVRFMEKIFKKHIAITAYYELTYMAENAHREIHEQLANNPDICFNHYYLHLMYPDDSKFPEDKKLFDTLQEWGRKNTPYPYSVITFRPYRDIKGVAIVGQSGDTFTQEYYLNDLYGIITIPLGLSHISPTFTVINEPFGFWDAYMGGYFTSCEQQISEEAQLAARILKGTPPSSIPITESAKEYLVDWHTLDRFNLDKGIFPPEVRFVNMPFYERYKPLVLSIGSALVFFILLFISYVIYLYVREQKRKEEALRCVLQKNTSLELAIQGGSTYVWKFVDDKFIFEHAVGNLPQQVTWEDFKSLVHPDDSLLFESYRNLIWNVDKKIRQYRCKLIGSDYEWWEFRFSSMNVGTDKKRELSGLLINIQEVKNKEKELTLAKELAEKAELKQSFLANMSHEIRTPLNAIVGFTNLLVTEDNLEETEKKEFVETINRNCDLLLMLISDVLELSRHDSGHMSFYMEECSVEELIDNLYATHRMLIPARLEFLKEVGEHSPIVFADAGRLSQVITNFLTNACKFTETGFIKLGFEFLEKTNEVSIFVEDSGKGIPEEQQKMIFSRFYKQDEFVQGTGLGLAICKGIAEKLGGQIELHSKCGVGSRFSIILPCM